MFGCVTRSLKSIVSGIRRTQYRTWNRYSSKYPFFFQVMTFFHQPMFVPGLVVNIWTHPHSNIRKRSLRISMTWMRVRIARLNSYKTRIYIEGRGREFLKDNLF